MKTSSQILSPLFSFRNAALVALASIAFGQLCSAATPADPKAKSDVLGNEGRNLSGSFNLSSGHNGLSGGGSAVLEVLGNDKNSTGVNKTCVHTNRSLADFKAGGYWGAKYDSSLSSATLARVYDTFKSQGNSYKATYSLLLPNLKFRTSTKEAWVVGSDNKLVKKQTTGDATLRCDFAVAAAFQAEASKYYGPSTWGAWLPKTVFNNVPKSR